MTTAYRTDHLHFQHETGKDNNLLSQEELLCYRPISQACHAYCKAAGLDQDLVVAVTTIIIFFVVVVLVGVFLWVNTEEGSCWSYGILPSLTYSSSRKKKKGRYYSERSGYGGGDGDVHDDDVEWGQVRYMDVLYSESDGDNDRGSDSDGDNRKRDSDGDSDSDDGSDSDSDDQKDKGHHGKTGHGHDTIITIRADSIEGFMEEVRRLQATTAHGNEKLNMLWEKVMIYTAAQANMAGQ